MSLFRKSEPKQSIRDFLKTDILSIPDETFILEKTEIKDGIEVKTYMKKLDYNEFGVFNIIRTIVFDDKKNISFINASLSNLTINQVASAIDTLYKIFGKDDNGKRTLISKEESDFYSATTYALFGRSWMDRYTEYRAALTIDRDDDTIELTLWFVPLNN